MTTTTEPILTKEQIALKYYEHNLTMIKNHIESDVIAEKKQTQMVIMVSALEELLGNYVRRIENIDNEVVLKNCHELERIWKLELIEAITKF
jgi:hypothetical protein